MCIEVEWGVFLVGLWKGACGGGKGGGSKTRVTGFLAEGFLVL